MKEIQLKIALYVIYTLAVITCAFFIYDNLRHQEHTEPASAINSEEAASELLSQANADTNNLDLQLQAARILMQKDEYKNALMYYKRLEKSEAENADFLAEIGTVYWLSEPSLKAALYFSKALKLDSTNSGALIGFGRISKDINELKSATDYFKRVIRFNKNENAVKIAQDYLEQIEKDILEETKKLN